MTRPFFATVDGVDGGEVILIVDRSTTHYPEKGARVLVFVGYEDILAVITKALELKS